MLKIPKILLFFTCSVILIFSGAAQAVPMTVNMIDTDDQDTLPEEDYVHELGNKPPFPDEEWITSSHTTTDLNSCEIDYGGGQNYLVSITNNTNRSWDWLVYVADPETTITNDDGLVNNQLAFLIDDIELNQPLVSESITTNGIFEPDETWEFILQEYTNTNALAPSLFGSIGVGDGSSGDMASSGSIIPEPTTICLLALGGLALLRRRRK